VGARKGFQIEKRKYIRPYQDDSDGNFVAFSNGKAGDVENLIRRLGLSANRFQGAIRRQMSFINLNLVSRGRGRETMG